MRVEIHELKEKLEHCRKECYELEHRLHECEEECHHLKVECHHLREECFRIKKIAHHRIERLYEKICHFVKLEKEISCLFEKMEGLCHVEDVMREEIHFERSEYVAKHVEEIHVIPFKEEHHMEVKMHHEHRDVKVGHHDYVSKYKRKEHHDDRREVREVIVVEEHIDVRVVKEDHGRRKEDHGRRKEDQRRSSKRVRKEHR